MVLFTYGSPPVRKLGLVFFIVFLFGGAEKGGGVRGGGQGFWFLMKVEGGGGGLARETGTMWQIGVLTWKPCTFGPFSGASSFSSHSHQ